jgi:molybdenum cofactor cytidylyltransferase
MRSTRTDAMIAGLLLASGASRRFGSDKLLAPLGDRPLIRWSADALTAAADTTFVVVREISDALRTALAGTDLGWVINRDAHTGMASSIRAGIAALPPKAEAVVVALADQPLLDPQVARGLVERWRRGGARAVAPVYADGRGHPVLFDASLYARLLTLDGDRGARSVLDELDEALAFVSVAGPQPVDVDTPEVLRSVAADLARRVGRGA